jgi:hypothetical protein
MLINHARISPCGPTHAMTEDVFDRVYALNVKVPSCLVAALAPRMVQRGTGAIVSAEGVCARGTTASAQSRQARSPRRCRRRGDRVTDPRSPPLRGRRGHRFTCPLPLERGAGLGSRVKPVRDHAEHDGHHAPPCAVAPSPCDPARDRVDSALTCLATGGTHGPRAPVLARLVQEGTL